MRIRILSDLHLEHCPWEPQVAPCDVVVLAGDIHEGLQGLSWAQRCFAPLPVIYVAGNHEYYGHDWDGLRGEMAAGAAAAGLHLLDCGSCVLRDVRFIGCTLWTDFDLFGAARRAEAMAAAQGTLFDYRRIYAAGRLLTPEAVRQRHERERLWLEEQLRQAPQGRWRATVVVTHMVPSERSTATRFKSRLNSAGFASHLDALVRQADVWVHGHTHDSYDYRVGDCRVVCNPRGYQNARQRGENRGFVEGLVIEV